MQTTTYKMAQLTRRAVGIIGTIPTAVGTLRARYIRKIRRLGSVGEYHEYEKTRFREMFILGEKRERRGNRRG